MRLVTGQSLSWKSSRSTRRHIRRYSLRKSPRSNTIISTHFAGAGIHVAKRTGESILGSPLNALNIDPPFKHYHLIDLDGERIEYLRRITKDRQDVTVYESDCNTVLLDDVLPKVRYEDYRRALCILDPYRLNPDWTVVAKAGRDEIRGNIPELHGNGHEHECALEKSERCCSGTN